MIEVVFKCRCMAKESSFYVRARQSDEDIKHWMEKALQPALGASHAALSPSCRSTVTEFVKFRVGDDDKVGTPYSLKAS